MSGCGNINHPLRDEAELKTKKVNDHSRSSVNTREVSEGSMGVTDTLGLALVVLMARCKTRKTFVSTRGRTGGYSSPATQEKKRPRKCPNTRTAGDIVSTAVGIIQYWEGTPHRVLLSSRTAVSVYGQMYNSALLHPYSSSSLCLAQGLCVTRVLFGTMYRAPVPSIISNFKRGQG